MLASLERLAWTDIVRENHLLVTELLKSLVVTEPLPQQLLAHRHPISRLVDNALQAEDFFGVFETGLDQLGGDGWMAGAVETYRNGSPTTALIFHEQIHRAVSMSLADTLRMELNIAGQCVRHLDFPEGVRALLVDKDSNPNWRFDSTADVPLDYVLAHFESPWPDSHPLADLE